MSAARPIVFLCGPGALTLGPVPKGAPLPSIALRAPDSGAREPAIEFAARSTGDGPVTAILALAPLDWIRRTAGLTARGDVTEAMLALALRYVFDELNLERVDTDPVDASLAPALRAVGFAPAGDRWSCFKAPA